MSTLPIITQGIGEDVARKPIAEKIKAVIGSFCRRVLVINPPQISEADFLIERALNNRYWIYQPYGPGVLCRNLEERGYETDLLDLNFEVLLSAHEEKEAFEYRIWREKLYQALDNFSPDVIGISCMFTMTHAIMKEISEAIKAYDPSLPIIAGGVHPSNATKLVLEDCRDIDFIGLYECDHSFPDMLDFVNGKLGPDRNARRRTLRRDQKSDAAGRVGHSSISFVS